MSEAPKEVRVVSFIDSKQLRADIAYSLTDLSNAMQEQAQFRVHYGELSARAAKQVDDIKLLLEVAEARAYRELRDKFVEEKLKITEPLLEKEVSIHARVIKMKRALNEAKQIAASAKSAYDAFGDRKDMLVQHGAKDRVEMQGELRIRAAIDAAESGNRILERQKQLRGDA